VVPEPRLAFDLTMADGAVIRVRRHGNPDGPRLVLSHGNGFAIDGYLPFWSELAAGYDLVLYDQRNHGRNPRHDVAHHDVPHFVSDMGEVRAGIAATLGAKPSVGMFHSISAIAAIWDALENGMRWDALVLFDPPLFPPLGDGFHEVARAFDAEMSNWAATRPDRFADPAALAAALKTSYRLRRWVDGAQDLMARSILRPDGATGEWVLCCPRDGESRVYITDPGVDLWSRLDRLAGPVVFICSDPDQDDALAPGKVNREMHARFGHRYEMVPATNHLLQIEKPGECARLARAFLAEHGLGPARASAPPGISR
jgi:pimeloyl-ACP methyl ester carboxylesterase